MKTLYFSVIIFILFSFLSGCSTPQLTPVVKKDFVEKTPVKKPIKKKKKKVKKHFTLKVTATAYTSSVNETDDTPFLAAWNNKLTPGVKSIAISRDLLALGLKNGDKIRIDGLHGTYKVLDKMNKRWKKKIDIYMGLNRKKALQWGRKKVIIRWAKVVRIREKSNV
ncbi:MAG: FIG01205106: hypothetical protein [uncultured Sulfurovum sp.]|uniref:3D domain-containing protein n=1 Tax=uncultured Sulfurovum sp. TaxID=269237 RepID=A0A6S6S2A6_9BACT|nr:MAG: FIG01205106: hypothetical protein [uncultured Sulfurovum sp.]